MSTTTSDSTQSTDTDPRGVVAPLLFGFFPNQVLHVAATLALPDRLLDGPRTADDLAAETGTHGPSLYRVLRALACFGILAETGPGTFALGPHGRSLLTDDPASLRHLVLLFSGDGVWRSWGELGETVRTGEPAWDRVTGMSAFEHMAAHPDEQEMFNRASPASRARPPAAGPRRGSPGGSRRGSWWPGRRPSRGAPTWSGSSRRRRGPRCRRRRPPG